MDALNGRTYDGRDLRITIDAGRPSGGGGGRYNDRDRDYGRRLERSNASGCGAPADVEILSHMETCDQMPSVYWTAYQGYKLESPARLSQQFIRLSILSLLRPNNKPAARITKHQLQHQLTLDNNTFSST